MNRRRAQAVKATELPLVASRVTDWTTKVTNSVDMLPDPSPGALKRLAAIAKAYRDGKRLEAARTSRPDTRKSLEVLSKLAAETVESLLELPVSFQNVLVEVAKCEAPRSPVGASLGDLGVLFWELSEVDLTLWQLGTSDELASKMQKSCLLLSELAERCSNLPMDAEWQIIALNEFDDLLPAAAPESNFLCVAIRNLSGKSQVASELMKSVRGPRSDTHKMRAVIALKTEFDRGGKRLSHNPGDTAGYTGVGTSAFDKFVHQFFKDIDPADTQRRGVNDATAFACRTGRQASRENASAEVVGSERTAILNLLMKAGVTYFSPDS